MNKMPSAPPEDGASVDHPKAQAAPAHPGAPPEHLGGSPRPSPPASGRRKVEDSPMFPRLPPAQAAALGGYFFNLTRLEGHLEISDQAISADLADSSWHLALSLPPPHLPLISIRWPHIHPAPPVICL